MSVENVEKETISLFKAAKLFTFLLSREKDLYGFKLVSGKLVIMTRKGYYDVKVLRPTSEYDELTYVKFRGVLYRYNPKCEQLPWLDLCYI